jgi:hypothetical protein
METEAVKKKGFIEGLKKEFKDAFSVKPPSSVASKVTKEEKTGTLSVEKKGSPMEIVMEIVSSELRALENEHQAKIDMLSKNLQSISDSQAKLKSALDALRELNLSIPTEFTSRLDRYPVEIEKLEAELEREKVLLNYLQTRVLPLIQKI